MNRKKDSLENENSSIKHYIIGILIILLSAGGIYGYYLYNEAYPSTDDAYVGSSLINVAPKVNGYLDEVNVKNNQLVHKGDLLFSINPIDYDLSYKEAKHGYASQVAQLAAAKEQLTIQDGQMKRDTEDYTFAKERKERYEKLYAANTLSKETFQQALTAYQMSQTQLEIDNKKYKQYQAVYDLSKAKQDQAKVYMDAAKSNLDYTDYYAPVDGYVTNMNSLATGEFVSSGQSLFGLVADADWWIDANFKETQIARIKPGQKASITLDMYDGHKYTGIVTSISYASGNIFSLLPAQNATGNWVKVTQRFLVRIKIKNDPEFALRVGASAKVEINTNTL